MRDYKNAQRSKRRSKAIKRTASIAVLGMITLSYVCTVFQPSAKAMGRPELPKIDPCDITITTSSPERLEEFRKQDIQQKIEAAAAEVYMDVDNAVRIAKC